MRYLLCCLSRSSADTDGVHECDQAEYEVIPLEKPGTLCGGSRGDIDPLVVSQPEKKAKTNTVDKGVHCRLDYENKNLEGSLLAVTDVTQISPITEVPLCPVGGDRVGDDTPGSVEDNVSSLSHAHAFLEKASISGFLQSNPVRTSGTRSDGALTSVLRRILSRGQITAPDQNYSKSTVNDNRLRGFVHRVKGKLRKNEADNSSEKKVSELLEVHPSPAEPSLPITSHVKPSDFSELLVVPPSPAEPSLPITSHEKPSDFSELLVVPPSPAEPSLPITSHEKPSDFAEKSDLSKSSDDPKCGQGDALLPGCVIYATPSPGQHLLQPQVLPVFSWSVPVFRTRLAEGGVSFSFGGGSEHGGSSSTGASSSEGIQVPPAVPASFTTTCTNPTPMEVDEPQTPDGSLLNHLVQLTNSSPVDNQQLIQNLREDMQRQLDLQIQLQQQLYQQMIQQEVEARIRQMRAAGASDAAPDRVSFNEWTLVLRYPSNRKIADRPMGTLGYDPLRNYQLKRRSSDTQQTEPGNDTEPKTKDHTEPVPICPRPNPPQAHPAPACPQTPGTTQSPGSESVPVSPQVQPPEAPKPEVEPSTSQPGVEPSTSQPVTDPGKGNPKSELDPGASLTPVHQGMENEPGNEQPPACVKKSKSRKVTIKQEKLDDDYDVF